MKYQNKHPSTAQDSVLEYYRRLILKYSVVPTGGLLVFLFLAMTLIDQLMQSRQNQLLLQRNGVLADQVLENFVNVTRMIATSSHGVTALRFGDFIGFQGVVAPWVNSEPRIKGYALLNRYGSTALVWPKNGKQIGARGAQSFFKKIPYWVNQDVIYVRHTIYESGAPVGFMIFKSDFESLGLKGLTVKPQALTSSGCMTLEAFNGLVACQPTESRSLIQHSLIFVFLSLLGLAALFYILSRALTQRLTQPVIALQDGLDLHRHGQVPQWTELLPKDSFGIFGPIAENFSATLDKVKSLNQQLVLRHRMSELTRQVAHDIRSPLSALNIIVATKIHEMPTETRNLVKSAVKRIQDVASHVLEMGKKFDQEISETSATADQRQLGFIQRSEFIEPSTLSSLTVSKNLETQTEVQHLIQIIEEVMSEKRAQYILRPDVEVDGDLKEGYGAFVLLNETDMKCVLSNVINNSAEALTAGGKIFLKVSTQANFVTLTVHDNGAGIPPEVLVKLGREKVSFGKDSTGQSGHGLGLYQAQMCMEKWGGRLEIHSELGKGTTVRFLLPLQTPPHWFVSKIAISENALVVCVDDDRAIHQLWTTRFLGKDKTQTSPISLKMFSSATGFEKWFNSSPRLEPSLILVDFEYIGERLNGLDLISKLQIKDRAILVTNRFYDSEFREKMIQLNCKVIPKNLAYCVPIEIEPAARNVEVSTKASETFNPPDSPVPPTL